ncbi:MAG TPA: NAD(P)/FAD-dependent oxidoreductase [Flavobacteriales bacterium]|nr:NAD(P)/FAD-dependent oxidoreductase [Flavobacteriales bacterium]HMR26506.1 NAD(P)/FAD-dependent oxidoreductase [Flavobacteriales bacterium]
MARAEERTVVVIGGGAAGHMAAIAASTQGARVLLLEGSDKLLAKVRISGGGRCNVTHACAEPARLARHYPRGGPFVRKVFEAFGQPDTVAWFAAHGVRLHTEADGRMFPSTNDSRTVIDALTEAARRAGVVTRLQHPVRVLEPAGDGWRVTGPFGSVDASAVVVATGGSPKAEGLAWLQHLGHCIVPPVPSLFTFNIPDPALRTLMGVSADPVRVRLAGLGLEATGPVLITHWGLSGPAVLRLSAFGARVLHERGYRYTVLVDWTGGVGEAAVVKTLEHAIADHPRKRVANTPLFGLATRLWTSLCLAAELPETKPWDELGRRGRDKLMAVLTNQTFPAQGKTTFKEEFVTAGGIDLAQVDPRTLESRVVPGLFFAGEVLDIDGITGGFNFQSAWSTGHVAGVHAARRAT